MTAKEIIEKVDTPLNDFFSTLSELNSEASLYCFEFENYYYSKYKDVNQLKNRMKKAVIGGAADELSKS